MEGPMQIGAWMTPNPLTATRDRRLGDAVVEMTSRRIRHLPVTADGRVVGVVTDDLALLRGAVRDGAWIPDDPADAALTVGEVARAIEASAAPDTSVPDALTALLKAWQDILVVVEDGVAVGVFTEHDAVVRAAGLLPRDLPVPLAQRPLVSVTRDASANEARYRMGRHRIRHVLVTDGGALYAVLSVRDLSVARDDHAVDDCVRATPPTTIGEGVTLRDAAAIMARDHIGCLPVVRDGVAVGIVTRTDVIRALSAHLSG